MDESLVAEAARGYLACAQWAEEPDNEPGWSEAEWGYGVERQARRIVMAFFYAAHGVYGGEGIAIWRQHFGGERIGHDLWLTTHGHGVGFWDRYPEVPREDQEVVQWIADDFTKICASKDFDAVGGGCYLGDDGRLYLGG